MLQGLCKISPPSLPLQMSGFNLDSISHSSHCRFRFELDCQRELTCQRPNSAASLTLQLSDQTKPTDSTLFPCKAINQLRLSLTLGQGLTERFMNLKESFEKLSLRLKFVMKPPKQQSSAGSMQFQALTVNISCSSGDMVTPA